MCLLNDTMSGNPLNNQQCNIPGLDSSYVLIVCKEEPFIYYDEDEENMCNGNEEIVITSHEEQTSVLISEIKEENLSICNGHEKISTELITVNENTSDEYEETNECGIIIKKEKEEIVDFSYCENNDVVYHEEVIACPLIKDEDDARISDNKNLHRTLIEKQDVEVFYGDVSADEEEIDEEENSLQHNHNPISTVETENISLPKQKDEIHSEEEPNTCIQEVEVLMNCDKTSELDEENKIPVRHKKIYKKRKGRKTEYTCEICTRTFKTYSILYHHRKVHSEVRLYLCNICPKSYKNHYDLVRHIKSVHEGDKPFRCTVCSKTFSRPYLLSVHTRIHTGEKPYLCEFCSKSFKDGSALYIHKKSHLRSNRLVNDEGDNNNKNRLEMGEKSLRGIKEEKMFKCEFCGKYIRQSYYQVHLKTHSKDRPFSCNYCVKSFTFKGDLVKHLRTHSGEKPYQCDVCNKKFTRPLTVTEHKRRKHSDENPYKCSYCDKKFKCTSNLRYHVKTKHNTTQNEVIKNDNGKDSNVEEQGSVTNIEVQQADGVIVVTIPNI